MLSPYGIELSYTDAKNSIPFAVLTFRFKNWVSKMKKNGTIKAAINDLKAMLDFHQQKATEIEVALHALKSVASNGASKLPTFAMDNKEFADTGIARATATLIKRSGKALHVKEIVEGLKAGGYPFKTNDPLGSVGPVLYTAAQKKRFRLTKAGKNTYSTEEVEKDRIQ